MFDIGFGEMLLVAAIALIAIGPKQLPEVARTLGRLLNEFKRATGDFTKTFTDTRTIVQDTQRSVVQSFMNLDKEKDVPPPPSTSELASDIASTQSAPVTQSPPPSSAPTSAKPGHSPEDQLAFHLTDHSDDPHLLGAVPHDEMAEIKHHFPLTPSHDKKDS